MIWEKRSIEEDWNKFADSSKYGACGAIIELWNYMEVMTQYECLSVLGMILCTTHRTQKYLKETENSFLHNKLTLIVT